ncbi:aldehyde dehydrogenase family protein [Streptomyces sp. NPDC093223]|uniref:aldehyde dehydrogenase family protein n=1 Tax=Streptomyces sp. NPDC093223 TaxID=3366033 RepID=UPI0038276BC7
MFEGPGRPEGFETGAYVRPTIFSDVDPDSAVAQEEIFGPVLTVIPYGDDDHAMAIPRRLRVGQVDVSGGERNFQVSSGGYKQSGNGREMGQAGIEEFLETKAITR